jgi:hypothetical protein
VGAGFPRLGVDPASFELEQAMHRGRIGQSRVRSRDQVWRSAVIGITFLIPSGGLTEASATWSGYWTYELAPPPPTWVWTWIWTSPDDPTFTASAVDRTGSPDQPNSSSSNSANAAIQDCCGITIFDFGKLKPASIELSGLLATDFVIHWIDASNTDSSDLMLQYIGKTTLDPGTFLGLMTLTGSDGLPDSNPPIELTYKEAFRDVSGTILGNSGVINSAVSVSEPGSLSLLVGFLAGTIIWVVAGYRTGSGFWHSAMRLRRRDRRSAPARHQPQMGSTRSQPA